MAEVSSTASSLEEMLGPIVKELNARMRRELRDGDEKALLEVYRAQYRQLLVGKRLDKPLATKGPTQPVGTLLGADMLNGLNDDQLAKVSVEGVSCDVTRKFEADIAGVKKAMDARAADMAWNLERLAGALSKTELGCKALVEVVMSTFPIGRQSRAYTG